MSIPKIIHQLWIGTKPAPIKLMDTWKDKHPNFEYIYWNEEEFIKRNMTFKCQDKISKVLMRRSPVWYNWTKGWRDSMCIPRSQICKFCSFLRLNISIMVKYTRILSTVYKVLHTLEKEFLNVEMNGISYRNEAKRKTVLNLFCQGPRLVRIMKKVENHVLHSHQWY